MTCDDSEVDYHIKDGLCEMCQVRERGKVIERMERSQKLLGQAGRDNAALNAAIQNAKKTGGELKDSEGLEEKYRKQKDEQGNAVLGDQNHPESPSSPPIKMEPTPPTMKFERPAEHSNGSPGAQNCGGVRIGKDENKKEDSEPSKFAFERINI